jgi:hypothetical protein
MRLFLISLLLAFVFCLPQLAEQMDFSLPARGLLAIPATGLSYMLVFFHEIGHTVCAWLFGMPAFPQFDFTHGGGLSRYYDRSYILLAVIWLLMAALAVRLYRAWHYRWLIVLGIGFALHLLLTFTRLHSVFISFMGHGTEVLVGAFCMLRAFWNTTEKSHGAAERWLNMVFGIFALLSNMILTAGLVLSDISRAAYAMQKGGHLLGDLDSIARAVHVPVQAVAGFLFLVALGVLAAAVYLGRLYTPHPAEDI